MTDSLDSFTFVVEYVFSQWSSLFALILAVAVYYKISSSIYSNYAKAFYEWFSYLVGEWTFSSVEPLIHLARKRKLTFRDLDGLKSYERTENVSASACEFFHAQGCEKDIVRLLLRLNSKLFITSGIYTVLDSVLDFTGPVFLYKITSHLEKRDSASLEIIDEEDFWLLFYWLVSQLFLFALSAFVKHRAAHHRCSLRTRSSAAIRSLLFRKVLSLRSDQSKENVGSVTSLINSHTNNVSGVFANLHSLYATPLTFFISIFAICWLLGYAGIIGCSIIVLMFPVQSFISSLMSKCFESLAATTDARVNAEVDVLSKFRLVKYTCLQNFVRERVEKLFYVELQSLRDLLKVVFGSSIFANSLPNFVCVVAFTSYAVVFGQRLYTSDAFALMALLGSLDHYLNTLPNLISNLTSAKVSLQKIGNVLTRKRSDSLQTERSLEQSSGLYLQWIISVGTA